MTSRIWNPAEGFSVIQRWLKDRPFSVRSRRSRRWYLHVYERCVGGAAGPQEITGGIRVRRHAGAWVRSRMRQTEGVVVAVLSGTLGMVGGVALVGMAGWKFATLSVLCLAAGAVFLVRRHQRGTATNLLKGLAAERHVGGLIEYAITAPGCAIAHSVTGVADVGDIDHLVATPGTLWVLETKYRKVPNARFPEVLRRIVANVEAVRRWSGPGVTVRGCLVLAVEEEMPYKRLYENGQVEVLGPLSIGSRIHEASLQQPDSQDLAIAKQVWGLAGERLD